jgi:hypothetical protein
VAAVVIVTKVFFALFVAMSATSVAVEFLR